MKNNIKKISKKFFLICLVLLFCVNGFAKNEGEVSGVDRYAIYIGSNVGGKNNARLLYAGTDAISFQKTMSEIGGIPKSQGILLLDPSKNDVDNALQIISQMIVKNKNHSRRAEFVFYYSGHSDETALLLGKTSYDYSLLKQEISKVPSEVHVVILDSCYSGSFIRAKGGQKQKPFLLDDSSVVKGHAYLSSSSSQESSQESDEIESSFFTNAMITGLRGAADSSGDKKVTLNELYSYAFNETLSKTENTTTGPQHPNYNITLVGSGDLVLSDISSSDSVVTLSKDIIGRVIIRDKNSKLVSEINKTTKSSVFLALEEGQYAVTVIGENSTHQGNFSLTAKKSYVLSLSNLSSTVRVANRTRGQDDIEEEKIEDQDFSEGFDYPKSEKGLLKIPFVFSFVCNEFYIASNKDIATLISIGVLRSSVFKVNGVMASGIGNEAKIVNGAQAAGVYNVTTVLTGAQGAGVFNIANVVRGGQGAGVFNFARDVTGGQGAGVLNIANDVIGGQGAGVLNIANDVIGAQGAGVVNIASNVKYAQGAGILNVAVKDAKGVQAAGIANVTCGKFSGVQASGIFNYAKSVKGVQLGLVNICPEDVKGLQIGLINYSKNGIFEIGTSYSTNNNLRTVLNSGSKHLYTILGFATAPQYYFNANFDDNGYVDILFGIGHRLELGKFNLDFEVISNGVVSVKTKKPGVISVSKEDEVKSCFYPTLRISAGFSPVKHLKLFAGAMMSYEFDWNHEAFERQRKNWVITTHDVNFHPEFDFGVRFSVN